MGDQIQHRDTQEFKELLRSKIVLLQEHAQLDYTHVVFSFDDEYKFVRREPLIFVESGNIISKCVVDKGTETKSFDTMKMQVQNIWCKALLFLWFSYNRSDGYGTVDSLWKSKEETRAFYIAINILRQFELTEEKGIIYIRKANQPDSFYTVFPFSDDLKIPSIDDKKHVLRSCRTELDPFVYESIVGLNVDDKLWDEVYKELVFLIPMCLYVFCPLVYQCVGHSVITKRGNHGLVVRSFMFECMSNLYVESDDVISNIWRFETDGDYYNLNYTPNHKENHIDHMLAFDYEIDNLPSRSYVVSEADGYDTLTGKYEHQTCFNIIRSFVDYVTQAPMNDSNVPLLRSRDDSKLKTIIQFIDTNDIVDPLELYTTKKFGDFYKTLTEVFGSKHTIDLESILKKQIDLDQFFRAVTQSAKVKLNEPQLTTVGPALTFANNDTPTSEDFIVLTLAYKLLDLFSGCSRVLFNANTVTIGNNFQYSNNNLRLPETYDYEKMEQFITKLEKISDFISFLKVCRIYNTDYYNKMLHIIHSLTVVVINKPSYEADIGETTIFTGLSRNVKPHHGAVLSIIELLKATTIILNISLFERSCGMTVMDWFSAYVEKLTISIEDEIDLNNFIGSEEPSLYDIITSTESLL